MEFETQAQLLRYLGKNENDRNLVQRMIMRGEVLKENGMYILVDKDKKIEELISEVEKLRDEIVTIKESNWDLDEAKKQRKHFQWLARYNKELLNKVLEIAYRKIRSIPWVNMTESEDDFIEWIMESAKEIVWKFEE